MTTEILVPSLGESITEATVSKWLKNAGETVTSDEPLVELETEKVNVEVPAPSDGILSDIKVNEGETVKVGALLGVIGKGELKKINKIETKKEVKKTIKEPEDDINESKVVPIKKKNKKEVLLNHKVIQNKVEEKTEEVLVLTSEVNSKIDSKIEQEPQKDIEILSPAVRKIVSEKNIDISSVSGSGKDGRILKGDIINLMGEVPKASERRKSYGPEEIIKMSKLRQTIARRLKDAQNNSATLTTFNEVDMHEVINMRKNYQEDFQKKYSIKLGFMSFFVKASIVALKNFPSINAEVKDDQIVYKNYYNIGIAVGTEKGLVVPTLRNADQLSFASIEKNILSLSEKAKQGKLTIENLQGGSFTITNGGIYGSMLSTPILNPPQSGILGMHNIVERPITRDGNIISRPVMYLALSYDHRIIDGKEAVSFLKCIKDCLEEPRRLFLDL